MTGYGRAVETVNGREFTVEVRSVNNRYLDCSVRLPRILSFGEENVKQAVKNAISRGKVDVYITVRSEGGDEVQVTLNKAVLESYLEAMRQMVSNEGFRSPRSMALRCVLPMSDSPLSTSCVIPLFRRIRSPKHKLVGYSVFATSWLCDAQTATQTSFF